MAITVSNKTLATCVDTNTGDKSVTLGAPLVGDLAIAVVIGSGVTGTYGFSDNSTDGLGTYARIATILAESSVDQATFFVRNAFFGTTSAPTFTTTGLTGSTGGGFQMYYVTGGMPAGRVGATAVRQQGTISNQPASTPAVTFPAAALTTSVIMALIVGTTVGSQAAPTGFTSFGANTYTVPAYGVRGSSKVAGYTTAGVTWGGANTATFAAMAFELDATAVGLPPSRAEFPALQAVNRSAVFMRSWSRRARQDWRRQGSGILVPA